MYTTSIHIDRIQRQNDREIRAEEGVYVLYWMQQAQRAEYNHALEFAVVQANALQQPCLVIFGLTDDYPDANWRHYTFMLEGLRETQQLLSDRGIKLVVRLGAPDEVAIEAAKDASIIVYDRGYLRPQRISTLGKFHRYGWLWRPASMSRQSTLMPCWKNSSYAANWR